MNFETGARQVVSVLAVLVVVSCGLTAGVDTPPPFEVVTVDGATSEIPAMSFCWTRQLGGERSRDLCQSGAFEPHYYPVEIPTPELDFELPLVGWTLEGKVYPAGTHEAESLPILSAGDGSHAADLPGPGIWDVQVSGRGPEGDASYIFRVTVREP